MVFSGGQLKSPPQKSVGPRGRMTEGEISLRLQRLQRLQHAPASPGGCLPRTPCCSAERLPLPGTPQLAPPARLRCQFGGVRGAQPSLQSSRGSTERQPPGDSQACCERCRRP
eukprot:2795739-Alexandrium_andersonii.AAC.1